MKLKNQIVESGFYSIIQIITSSLTYVGVYIFIIYYLGREQLGIWSMITAIPAVVSFLGSGVSGSLLRYIPIYKNKGQGTEINQIVYNGIIFNFLLAVLIVIPALIFSSSILKFMFGISTVPEIYYNLFYITLGNFIVNFIGSVCLSGLDGLQLIPYKNKILIFSSLLFCVLGVVLIYLYGLPGLLYAQLLQSLVILLCSADRLIKDNDLKFATSHIDRRVMLLFHSYGSGLQYISILNILFEPATKFFLNRYFGLSIVGGYDLVNRIITQIRMLIISAIQVIVPFVAKSSDEKDFTAVKIYEKAQRGALLSTSILYGGLLSLGFSFIYLFRSADIAELHVLLIYLTIANVFNILAVPSYYILQGAGKLKPLIISHAISTGLNILLFLLLEHYVHTGLALLPTCLATSISSVFVIKSFKDKYILKSKVLYKHDIFIYAISIFFPLVCIIVSIFSFNLTLLLSIACIHGVVILIFIFKNNYLMEILDVLLKGRKTSDSL